MILTMGGSLSVPRLNTSPCGDKGRKQFFSQTKPCPAFCLLLKMFLFKVQCHKIFRISKKIMGEQKTRIKSYSYSPPFVHNFFELHESLKLQNCLSKIQKISQKTNRIHFGSILVFCKSMFQKSKTMPKNSKNF